MSRLRPNGEVEPPLPRWPDEPPRVDEPAHGYVVRLAAANHQHSASVLLESFGLDGRAFRPDECLRFALSMPIREKNNLVRATPIVTRKTVDLMGERFRKRDWSNERRFFCPACVAEDPYHRCYWDLTVYRRCPHHDTEIVCRDKSGRLVPRWFPSFTHSPLGHDLRQNLERAALRMSIEAYILGRLGLETPISVPMLDCLQTMAERFAALRLVGQIVQACEGSGKLQGLTNFEGEATAVRAGFPVVLGGRPALKDLFSRFLERRTETRSILSSSLRTLFGEAYVGAQNLFALPSFSTECRNAMFAAAAEAGEISARSRSRTSATTLAKWTPIKHLAVKCGVTPRVIRHVAERLSLFNPKLCRFRIVQFDHEDARVIRDTIAALVDRSEAATLLGVGRPLFDGLVAKKLIRPLLRFGKADLFHPDEILAFGRFYTSQADLTDQIPRAGVRLRDISRRGIAGAIWSLKRISQGAAKAIGRQSEHFGDLVVSVQRTKKIVQGHTRLLGVGIREAALTLRVERDVIRAAIKEGLLKKAEGNETRNNGTRIDPSSWNVFAKKYASAMIYRPLLGSGKNRTGQMLTNMGVEVIRLQTSKSGAYIVDRASAREILGLPQDPDAATTTPYSEFISELAKSARMECSVRTRVSSDSLFFESPRGTLSIKVRIGVPNDLASVGVHFSKLHSQATLSELEERRASILATYPNRLDWQLQNDGTHIEEVFECPIHNDKAAWNLPISRIVARLHAFRALFDRRQRSKKRFAPVPHRMYLRDGIRS